MLDAGCWMLDHRNIARCSPQITQMNTDRVIAVGRASLWWWASLPASIPIPLLTLCVRRPTPGFEI
jgi:hypothetical protein